MGKKVVELEPGYTLAFHFCQAFILKFNLMEFCLKSNRLGTCVREKTSHYTKGQMGHRRVWYVGVFGKVCVILSSCRVVAIYIKNKLIYLM